MKEKWWRRITGLRIGPFWLDWFDPWADKLCLSVGYKRKGWIICK